MSAVAPLPLRLVAGTGGVVRRAVARQHGRVAFVGATLRSFNYPNGAALAHGTRVVIQQVRFSALHALPVVIFVAVVIGGTAILQAYSQAARLGSDLPARILATVVVRELGPLLTAVILLGRSGTAIAAELGGYRVMGNTDALEALGINPVQLFAIPRIIALALSSLSLVVIFDTVAVLSGLLAASAWTNAPFVSSVPILRHTLQPLDVFVTLGKSAIFGAGVALLCSYEGIFADRSVTDLPRAVSRAVVSCLVFIFVLSALLTAVFYL